MIRDALVVGINTYEYSGLSNLQAPAEDAEAIAKRLEQDGEFNVWRLPEAINRETHHPFVGKKLAVNLPKLKQALVKLFLPEGNSIPDTALFYFSGHGLRTTLGIPEGFLATTDVNPDLELNGLSLKWLRELLRESPIKQQIVWLDCCHSGELLNFRQEADPGEQGKGRDRCFIAASREFEVSYEEIGSAYSVLTRVLLEGLDPSRCPQRWVTNYSLVDYLNQHLQGATQRPTFTNFGEPINLTCTWKVQQQQKILEPTQAICPYKGLEYFDCNEEDPKYFYGRKELTDQLIYKVRQSSFLAIIGASGSGKSSVLRAGLLHQLKLGRQLAGSNQWQILVMVPGSQPLRSLAEVFVEPNLSKLDYAEQLGRAEGLLKDGADGLRRLVQSAQATRVVLVIDQFEEVFTLCQDKVEREQFIDCLLGALRQLEEQLCLILAMRADFFSNQLRLRFHEQTLASCEGTPANCPGRIKALEALTKARKDLAGINLPQADIREANLSGADLSVANLSNALLIKADLTGADFREADLNGADLSNANLSGADLWGVNFRKHEIYGQVENLTPKQVKSACNWQEAKFDPDFKEKLKKGPDRLLDCRRW